MSGEKTMKNCTASNPDEDVADAKNYNAHRHGITPHESTYVYDNWNTYDQDLCPERYRGPQLVAEAVGQFFQNQRENVLIIDVACGTGFVGTELRKLGFLRVHGLDPSSGMLEQARKKQIYEKDFCNYLDSRRLPIDDDVYDCAVIAGGMGEGHIPTAGLHELARIVKPGGLVCIAMREEYLDTVAEYKNGKLEDAMRAMETSGTWLMISRAVVAKYSFHNPGIVYTFVIC